MGNTTPGQNGLESNDKRVLHISQGSRIWTTPSFCLIPYPRHSLLVMGVLALCRIGVSVFCNLIRKGGSRLNNEFYEVEWMMQRLSPTCTNSDSKVKKSHLRWPGQKKEKTESLFIGAQNDDIKTNYINVRIDNMHENSKWGFLSREKLNKLIT